MTNHEHRIGSALVVGGGIGGMQAALDLTESGIKVYLVESKASIGGVMAQLDKTFPTNDCSMCIVAPRLVSIGRNKDVEILTLSQVEHVEGVPGHFMVRIKREPRYVDTSRCTGCSACTDACPITVPAEFEGALSQRKAIYRMFPQAVPNVYAISRRGASPCQAACPIHQSAQGYVALIAQKRFDEALDVILRENPLPSICGRICTHPCTAACTRAGTDDPVDLPALKRFVVDRNRNFRLPQPTVERPEQIAIIGSGPAGLMCAYQLRRKGYKTVIYEALPVAGGMLAVGVPPYRLPRPALDADVDRLCQIGIDIRLDTPIGRRISFEDLRSQNAAVFVGIGAHVERKLGVEGESLPGVMSGLEFLRMVNLGTPFPPGRRVLVVGGGNSALDTARTALRCGAKDVTILYRRTRAEMPADPREVEDTEREGVKLQFLVAPKEFHAGKNGRVSSMECVRMKLGPPDSSGRPTPVPIKGSTFKLSCDAVVVTIGHSSDVAGLGERLGLETTRWGTLQVNPLTMETSIPGVFAGGDCVTGPDVVVNAMMAGKKAAISIDRFINGEDLREGRDLEAPYRTEYTVDTAGVLMKRHIWMPSLDPLERTATFDEVHVGYSDERAVEEAQRCLACGICSDCQSCAGACDAHAIDFTQREERRYLEVGAIILAPGFDSYDPKQRPELGYGQYPNVITAVQFERVLSPTGPYSGHIQRPSDGRPVRRIAFIQCVGSRDAEHDYCSSVCCMYATKEAIVAKEHSKEELQCDIYYMDVRAHSKGFEQYFEAAKRLGVEYIRCRVPRVMDVPGTGNLSVTYLTPEDSKASREYDLVVLSTGMVPPKDAQQLASTFGIELNQFGFARASLFDSVNSSRDGVFVVGPFTEPKDIPETVLQGSAAAARVLGLLKDVRGQLISPAKFPEEIDVSGQEPRVGVFVCHCGTNIAGVVDVARVAEYAATLPNVVCTDHNLYTCSNDTQKRIQDKIKEHGLNRVVVASCTPRTHEALFRNTLREAGLNPFLFEMANIRDQCSWVHREEAETATEKAKDLVRMAVAKARLDEPLFARPLEINQGALVIGGGVAGLSASLALADQGFHVDLLEQERELGGYMRRTHYLLAGEDPHSRLRELVSRVERHPNIRTHIKACLSEIKGSLGNFTSTIAVHGNGAGLEIKHGVVIVATGADSYVPTEYMYGQDDRVVVSEELEERIVAGTFKARSVVFIQCVGSRNEEHPYCSRMCCAETLKHALRIKDEHPDTNVYVLYRDMRSYGFREAAYTKARMQGVVFIRFPDDKPPSVAKRDGQLLVTVQDDTLQQPVNILADNVVLAAATVPRAGNKTLAQMLKVPLTQDGFFLEAHRKLRPIDFATDGVFLCGNANFPLGVAETVAQALGAAARASTILSRKLIELEPTISHVQENCDGCAWCIDPCPFHAIALEEYQENGSVRKRVHVDEALCKGCGTCAATCPKDAISVHHFRPEQIVAQIHAALEMGEC